MPEQSLTDADVEHLADLARIAIPADELHTYTSQLGAILEAVGRVSEVAADDVPPMSHPQQLVNVTRPDERGESLTQGQALAGAPAREDDRFRVPQILGEPA